MKERERDIKTEEGQVKKKNREGDRERQRDKERERVCEESDKEREGK